MNARPLTAPPMRDGHAMTVHQSQASTVPGAARHGSVFVPEARRNNYFVSSTGRGTASRGGSLELQNTGMVSQSSRGASNLRVSSASGHPRLKKATAQKKNQFVQRQRPSTAHAGGRSDRANGIAQGSRKAMKRPASARVGSIARAPTGLELVAHPLATGGTLKKGRRSHHVTVPLTPNFTDIPKCDHRRSCACKPEATSSVARRVDVAGSVDEKILKPWK